MKSSLKKLLLVAVILILLVAAVPAMGASKNVRVFVEFSAGGKAAARNALQQAGAEFHYTFDDLNSFVVSLPAQSLNALSKNPNIVDIEEDAPRYPIRSMQSAVYAPLADTVDPDGDKVPYGLDSVQARDVWDADRDGSFDAGAPIGQNVKVCIIDSGYYAAHEDLAGVSHTGTAQLDAPYTTDGYGHGTHVAGTIAAQNNGKGVIGVAPGVSFYIVKFFGDDGLASIFASDLIAASNNCANAGARIISMSLGGSSSNRREERAFNTHYQNEILSIAAAGNDGTTGFSYPASYSSVVSVAAIDEFNLVADFSQKNSQVELAAPGVGVLSTLPYIDNTSLTVDGVDYAASHIEFSARGTASGALVDGGLCDSTGAWSGKVVLCERGAISFYDKVMNVQNSGGAAAVIYNNVSGGFLGTLGDGNSSTIIGLSISQEDGQGLLAKLGVSASVSSEFTQPASGYQAWNGTSMATPHVSAVAALLWSANPNATNVEIREAMTATAIDLGASGRDTSYGYGLVQALDALIYLGGGTPSNTAPTVAISAPADGTTVDEGTAITFTGTASDAEDGDLSGNISWTSSLNGSLGTGSSVTATLSSGTHTITASVTDSGGSTATDTITVTVNGGGTGTGSLIVSVSSDKPTYGKGETALITVSVADGNGAPVAGASVSVSIATPSNKVYSGSGSTDASGEVTFSFRTNPNKDGTGLYNVEATASLNGYSPGTGTTTFVVQ